MIETNKYTSDEKKLWWGYGEWCEEPDLVEFEHCGLKCKVIRVVEKEPYAKEFFMFGGHLCGYVSLDKDHPYYEKRYSDLDIDVYGGVTFGDFHDDGLYWIGFDCGHCTDITPSIDILKKRYNLFQMNGLLNDIREKYKDSQLFNPTYKNISFAIGECKALIEQLIKLKD